MRTDLPIVVVDTCVLFDVFTNNPERVARAKGVLRDHNRKHIVAVPALQEFELLAPARFGKGQMTERKAHIDTALRFIRDQHFVSIELNQFVAREAGRMWSSVSEKRNDIALLAAAKFYGARVVYTFDDRLIGAATQAGLEIQVRQPPAETDALFELS
jgi:predicted nucleic acid-binding protein